MGRHEVIAMVPTASGIGSVETANPPDGVYMKLSRGTTLRSVDVELTGFKGKL